MRSPFPGMDPYLEHPSLWPDVHNRLIAAVADAITPLVAPRYYVALERRTYLLKPDDLALIGRPDLAVVAAGTGVAAASQPRARSGVLEVDVPMSDRVDENFLQVHEVRSGALVTVLELLSPINKLHGDGRRQYEDKRDAVFRTRTSLVEIDLLRAGAPMAVVGPPVASDYRVLVSPGWQRPRAQLFAFSVRQPIPTFSLPLLPEDEAPAVPLGTILHDLYSRARFDLRLDYTRPPVPPLAPADTTWAQELVATGFAANDET